MLTKDMNQGGYSNPVGINDIQGVNNWQTHTIELVTYPSEISDTAGVESRKEAMLWLAKEFTDHINQSNHQSLPHLVSDDGRFTLVISNSKHLIAAGNGTSIDAQGKTIGMTLVVNKQQWRSVRKNLVQARRRKSDCLNLRLGIKQG